MRAMIAVLAVLSLSLATGSAHGAGANGESTADAHRRLETQKAAALELDSKARLNLERERLQLERDRLALEREKHAESKATEWIQPVTVAAPLMIAAVTLLIGVWNQSQQAKLQFELKAAEFVGAAGGPHGMRSRALSLRALFPQRLPPHFADAFDPKLTLVAAGESSQHKITFFQAVAPHIKDEKQLAELWQKLFPTDEWPARIVDVTPSRPNAA